MMKHLLIITTIAALGALPVYPEGPVENVVAEATPVSVIKKVGDSEPNAVAVQEDADRSGAQDVSRPSWEDWTRAYKAEFIHPPIRFDVNSDWRPDFSTAVNAWKSFTWALHAGEHDLLLRYADPSGKDILKIWGVEQGSVDNTFTTSFFKDLTIYNLVMTARTTIRGQQFVLFLARREAPVDPEKGMIFYSQHIVRNVSGRYIFTALADQNLFFSMPNAYANMNGPMMGIYTSTLPFFRKSDFPESFYTIQPKP